MEVSLINIKKDLLAFRCTIGLYHVDGFLPMFIIPFFVSLKYLKYFFKSSLLGIKMA